MILTLTNNAELKSFLSIVYKSEGIFSFFAENADDFMSLKLINAILIDGTASRAKARRVAAKLRLIYPNMRLYILLNGKYNSADYSRFDDVFDISSGKLHSSLDIFSKRNSLPENILRIGNDESETALLGYRLQLTSSEHRILLLLATEGKGYLSADIIAELALGSRARQSSVAVHMCSINKKAEKISGRRLILASRGSGYVISSEI